ncbi:serine hydrolase [Dyadobacter sp. CY343]|uniref:serine hydrolase domain-containing protein n=1 Tax=Dyadobacter sp. CY343 TaxID=2907299 RepID=UPI001F1F90BE|nr:serine hydrolase [Dyadobacter sp. CY343]MCE7062306.1 beta-lactamase family protein [Dyadobacter sp. CY343]
MARRITLFLSALAVLFINTFAGVHAQEPAPGTLDELKTKLAAEMQRQHIAGMMLAIVQDDSIVFSGGLGYADIQKKTPVTDQHLFRGASITKMFVAIGIMNLFKEGKLRPETKLRDIAPEIAFKNKWETTRPVTIAGLMEHTTGFSDKSPFEEYNFTGKPYTAKEAVEIFQDFMVSRWEPGQRHAYSSVNYAILDYIIGKVSGVPASEYLREKVFKPLQMPHANVALTGDGSDKYSKGYVWNDDHFQQVPHQPAFNAGYSSLNISAADFAHALKAYLSDWKIPSGQFLSEAALNDTETPHTYLSASAGLHSTYGYGNESYELGGHIFRGHRGAIGGFLSSFLYNRDAGLGYAFAINTHNESFFRYADYLISQFILQKAPKPASHVTYPVNHKAANPFLGYYRLCNPGQLYTGFFETLTNTIKVEASGKELKVRILGRGSMKWQAVDETGLRYKNQYANSPGILLLKDSKSNPVIVDGTLYFKKTTAFAAWASILCFAVSVLILVTTVFFLLRNLVLVLMKKIPRHQLLQKFSPVLITLGLTLILLSISQLFEHMKQAAPTATLFIIWTVGKYLFAFGTLLIVIFLALKWKSLNSIGLKVYLVLIALSSCYLFQVLAENSWYW